MPEIVRVDDASVREIEAFLSRALGRAVRLGPVWLASGAAGRIVSGLARASGVTFGRVVFLSASAQEALRGCEPDRIHLDALEGLLVHECVHVVQYSRSGTLAFLAKYTFSYCINISRQVSRRGLRTPPGVLDRAYRAIPFEIEAFALEKAWASARSHRTPNSQTTGTSVR